MTQLQLGSVFAPGDEVTADGLLYSVLKVSEDGQRVRLQPVPSGKTVWRQVWNLEGRRQGDDIVSDENELAGVSFVLRSKDPEQVEAWREMLHGDIGLGETEREQFRRAFVIEEGDIFGSTADCDAIVSPANSFGDMTGGIDFVYLRRFGVDLQRRLQERIRLEKAGEMIVGDAIVITTTSADSVSVPDPIRYCISAPTMRVPLDVRGSCNAYLAFRAVLLAVARHNRSLQLVSSSATKGASDMQEVPQGDVPIRSVLCPGLGTGVGLMPPRTCAYQMAMAYRQQVLQKHGCFNSATLDHRELVKLR